MSFFNSLQQYVTSSVANLSLSPKRFSLSKEPSAEGSDDFNPGAAGRSASTGSVSSIPGFPKVLPSPGISSPSRRKTLEGPRKMSSFRQPSTQQRQTYKYCKRRLSWPEIDQQANSGGLLAMPLISGFQRDHRWIFDRQRVVDFNRMEAYIFLSESFCLALGGLCVYSIGRKKSAIISNIFIVLPYFCLEYIESTNYDDGIKYLAVLSVYASHKFQCVIFTVYVVEASEPAFRAFFVGFFYLGYNFARYRGTRANLYSTSNKVVAVATLVQSFLVPETPFWLALRGRREEAEEVFAWLGAGTWTQAQADDLLAKADSVAEQRALLLTVADNVLSRQFGACLLITTFMMLTMKNLWLFIYPFVSVQNVYKHLYTEEPWFVQVQSYYNQRHFAYDFFRDYFPVYGSIVFMGLNFVFSRRVLFLVPTILQVFLFLTYPYPVRGSSSLLGQAGLLCIVFAHAGPYPLSLVYPAELFPAVTREIGITISYLMDWIHYQINVAAPRYDMYSQNNVEYAMILLQVNLLLLPVGIVFTFLFMPETKGMSLYEPVEISKTVKINILSNDEEINEEGE